MLSRQALRAHALGCCLAVCLLSAAASAQVALVGVSSVEFAWEQASGDPTFYAVFVAYNGSDYTYAGLVEDNRVEIPVEAGDRVSLYTFAVRHTPDRGYETGLPSEPSDPLTILAAPQLAAGDTTWIFACPQCNSIEHRDVSDAARFTGWEGPGGSWWPLAGTRISGDGALEPWLLWYDWEHGELLLTDAADHGSRIGPFEAPRTSRIEALDLQGDGQHEFLFLDPFDDNRMELFELDAQDSLRHVASVPGRTGGLLGPIADYTGDGRDDLLWIDGDARRAEVWSLDDFDPSTGRWIFEESYLLDLRPGSRTRAVQAADYDGNGSVDILLRGHDESFWIAYLAGPEMTRLVQLPEKAGDEQLEVVGAVDVDGVPGAEIALRNEVTGRIWIAYPAVEEYPFRTAVFDLDTEWHVVDVGL